MTCHLSSLLLLLVSATALPQAPGPSSPDGPGRARAAAAALMTLYNRDTGLFNTTGWWNSANAITALADESRLTRDPVPRDVIGNTFNTAPRKFPDFLNDFYDDEGWWALAWIDSYELTHRKPYLEAAERIFADMALGWDSTCGGGIWWSKERKYKNAIANELFLSTAAHLAAHVHGSRRRRYLDWAQREWTWFSHSGMINADHLINDGLTIDPATGTCSNNGKTTWSYNQGVLLGGLAALSHDTKQPNLLPAAAAIATAAVTQLVDAAGVLHDPCEPDCGEDGVQFKGIFARNLAELDTSTSDPRFRRFLATNAVALWTRARTQDNRFSTVWSGPPRADNAGAQASALDLLNAAVAVSRTSPKR